MAASSSSRCRYDRNTQGGAAEEGLEVGVRSIGRWPTDTTMYKWVCILLRRERKKI
jgi:hypothetical protein